MNLPVWSKKSKHILLALNTGKWKENKQILFLIALLIFSSTYEFLVPQKAQAASAVGLLMLDRMAQAQATGGSVCFNPVASETTVRKMDISFPVSGTPGTADATHFGVNQTAANWTWDTTSIPPKIGAATTNAFPGTATTSTVANGLVTFIVTADASLTSGTWYCLHFTGTNTLSTPTSSGSNFTGAINLRNSTGTLLTNETSNYATAILGANADQISVTGSVASTFSFSLSANTSALGTITTASNGTSATGGNIITATVSTNAQNGWTAWMKSANTALNSSATGDSIPSAAYSSGTNVTDLASSTGYVVDVTTGTGTPTINTDYSGNGTSSGGNLASAFKEIAYKTSPVSGNTFTITPRARATNITKAATDYTDTLTISAAGQF